MFGYFGWRGRQTNQVVEDLLGDKNTPLETILDQDNVKMSVNLPTQNATD